MNQHETTKEPKGGCAVERNVRLIHVGYQQRYLCPEEGPSIWQFCDDHSAYILRDRPDYELRPVYAVEA